RAAQLAKALDEEALGHFKKSEEQFLEILKRHPDDNVSLNNLGNLYFAYLDRLDDAIASVEKSISLSDKEPLIFAVAGEIYWSRALDESDAGKLTQATADYKKAVEKYRTYLERCGSDPNRAHIFDRKEKAERAIVNGGTRAEEKGPENG